ncbi:N-acyl-D-glucosamine 2-epimerase [Bifidobacterium avesanii]|uniref:AGE family epimerase/isomerase n=1 Tax=Bifidobacterium avesanii TaxID=1798157 RepID=A0A7K3TK30_9BIFI|nr:AGE family epimerase/isomerase [Bifidobacterium avesanii]KAB8287550.1 N-acyl-D-glucosamine 2-epimerase [Bifidobacterium avesanii]NEG79316.1 AGE family epimerase/isomerase [Bifidobacterium avesanii]
MAIAHQTDPAAYQLGTDENREFLKAAGEDLLAFGHNFPAPNGGSLWLNADGTTDPSHGVETWITSRMAHVYSMGAMLGHPGSEELADAALKGLIGPLHDDENGGWYPQVFLDGTHVPGKVCYAHAFVMLAASSALLAGRPGAKALLDEAVDTFLKRFWREDEGLTVDMWNTEFTELDPYRGINANMHTTEAFLALADVLKDESFRDKAGRIIGHVAGWAENNQWRIPEHFSADWQPQLEYNADHKDDQFKPYGATPGHGIEWARLITQYALSSKSIDEAGKKRLIDVAEHLFDRAVKDGWGTCEGGKPGLAYTTDWNGVPVVTDRMHWTLAEGINTSATLAKVTGKDEYREWYARFWQYADDCVIDHKLGSWFHQLDLNNKVIGTVWPGKSDLYHAFQSTLIARLDPAVSVAPALKARVDGIAAAPGANATARQLHFDIGRFPANVAWAIMSCM